jgi:hypothetical protein
MADSTDDLSVAFKSEYCGIARKLSEFGASDPDLADAFGVAERQISAWKKAFPEFAAACRLGKDAADGKVEQSLFKRATGYTYTVEKETVRIGAETTVVKETVQRHVPADVAAAKLWLRNRKPQQWRLEEGEFAPSTSNPLAEFASQMCNALRPTKE